MKYLRYWPVLVAALLLLWQRDCSMRAQGELKAEIKASQDRYAALEERGIVYDTTYKTDTLRFDAFKGKYAALRDSVLRADGRIDTLFVPPFVLIAYSTIKACSVALDTCEHRVAIRDSLIGNLKQQLGLERKRRPGLFAQLGQKVIWAGIGFGAAKVLSR